MKKLGKRVFDDHYIHVSAIDHLDSEEQIDTIRRTIKKLDDADKRLVNVIKINVRSRRVSLLEYSNFDTEPYPILLSSWVCEFGADDLKHRTYSNSINPPILHRKELLVDLDFPMRDSWIRTTQEAESIGLFEDTSTIGFKKNWEKRIFGLGFKFQDNRFIPIGNDVS